MQSLFLWKINSFSTRLVLLLLTLLVFNVCASAQKLWPVGIVHEYPASNF